MENKKRLTIGVFIGDTYTEHADELIKGLCNCAKKEEVNLVFLVRSALPCDTNAVLSDMIGEDFQVHFSSIYDYVPLVKPDALILDYGSLSIFSDTPEKERLYSYYQGIPCLLLKSVSDNPKVPYLVADNYVGMRDCIQHLITDHGYKKIAYLSGPAKNFDASERLRAYYDTMKKNGLDVTEAMVAYGDYSESADAQVNYLLDSNPGLEAIAFANDNMAKAGYRVCAERGIVVGKDLAITGFDDVAIVNTMNPPLTSVSHNSFLYSYYALKSAIQLAQGIPVSSYTVPTVLHKRASCGCKNTYAETILKYADNDDVFTYTAAIIDRLTDNFFSFYPYKEEKQQFKELLEEFLNEIVENVLKNASGKYNFSSQSACLRKLFEYPNIAPVVMFDVVEKLLKALIPFASDDSVRNDIWHVISSTRQYVLSVILAEEQSITKSILHQNWFTNSFTQDLMTSDVRLEDSLLCIMNRLKLINIESCYFFLRSEPAEYEKNYCLQTPQDIFLVAYYNNDKTVSMERKDWKRMTDKNEIASILPSDKIQLLTTYVLFAGQTQYGFLLCEHKPQNINFMSLCSLQIGSFLRYYYLNVNKQKIMKELEESMHLIQEQNSILNFISEYDELTKLLNRRGFMEKSLRVNSKNIGKTAYLLYADLDHLKEINDCFGHAAGDFSLQTVAGCLCACLPENAVIARIGGDEFTAFTLSDEDDFEQTMKQTIKDYINTFNQNSDKPYYIEASVGISKCKCSSKVSITDLLAKSDALLYIEKMNRRQSAKK